MKMRLTMGPRSTKSPPLLPNGPQAAPVVPTMSRPTGFLDPPKNLLNPMSPCSESPVRKNQGWKLSVLSFREERKEAVINPLPLSQYYPK